MNEDQQIIHPKSSDQMSSHLPLIRKEVAADDEVDAGVGCEKAIQLGWYSILVDEEIEGSNYKHHLKPLLPSRA